MGVRGTCSQGVQDQGGQGGGEVWASEVEVFPLPVEVGDQTQAQASIEEEEEEEVGVCDPLEGEGLYGCECEWV